MGVAWLFGARVICREATMFQCGVLLGVQEET
jgi:hypothetical protein